MTGKRGLAAVGTFGNSWARVSDAIAIGRSFPETKCSLPLEMKAPVRSHSKPRRRVRAARSEIRSQALRREVEGRSPANPSGCARATTGWAVRRTPDPLDELRSPHPIMPPSSRS